MKRVALYGFIFLLFSTFTVNVVINHDTDSLTKKEKFALEFDLCKKAYAKGKPNKCKLYGKIQLVSSFPDVKVQVVDSFPDIKVKMVKSFPNGPGKWQIVNSFPDYKVQIVNSFPDYKIQYVSSFPGCK